MNRARLRVAVCALEMGLSFVANWPPGATIVSAFGVALLVTAAVTSLKRKPTP